ncbi:Ig-like domain-containing protein [bacterium]|nr:Ig-like domain-containing protein [bacterium]
MDLFLSSCTSGNSVVGNDIKSTGDATQTSATSSTSGTFGTGTSTGTQTSSSTPKPPGNSAPVVKITVNPESVGFGGEVSLVAEAIDPDGDPVNISWMASEGSVLNKFSNKATWLAPSKVTTTEIICSADDGNGARGSAKTNIQVLGGRKYGLELSMSRFSLNSGISQDGQDSDWVPLSQAKVTIPELNKVAISDSQGKVGFEIDSNEKLASATEVWVQYLDWEVRYKANLSLGITSFSDKIHLYPGYEGVSVAIGRGDSFLNQRSGVLITTIESRNGQSNPLLEVSVDVGSDKQLARTGLAFLNSPTGSGEVPLTINKPGYSGVSQLKIPVSLDGVTLVLARLRLASEAPRGEAKIAWTKPYNGQKVVSVSGPFEIGFAQPMEKETIFDDIQIAIQEIESKNTVVVTGPSIKNRFRLEWDGNMVLRLIPTSPLKSLKRYSLLMDRIIARTVDGRVLKNYGGMFGTFTTDVDLFPVISATNPRNGDSGVPRSGPFVIRFDQPMEKESLEKKLLLEISDLETGSKVSIDESALSSQFSVIWSESDTTLSLVPKKMLKANHSYLVKLLKTGLRSKNQKPIGGLENLWGQFSTGEL